MINPIRSWNVRRRPPTKTFIGLASRFREAPSPEVAEVLVQMTGCPSCDAAPIVDCLGTCGRWDDGWLRQGADGHRTPRFHASRVALTQRRLGPGILLRRAGDPPHVRAEDLP